MPEESRSTLISSAGLFACGFFLRFEVPADPDSVRPTVDPPRNGAALIYKARDDEFFCLFHAEVATSAGQLGFG
jgi:hypothetical protein